MRNGPQVRRWRTVRKQQGLICSRNMAASTVMPAGPDSCGDLRAGRRSCQTVRMCWWMKSICESRSSILAKIVAGYPPTIAIRSSAGGQYPSFEEQVDPVTLLDLHPESAFQEKPRRTARSLGVVSRIPEVPTYSARRRDNPDQGAPCTLKPPARSGPTRGPRAADRPVPAHDDGRLLRGRAWIASGRDVRDVRRQAAREPGLPGLRGAGAGDRRPAPAARSRREQVEAIRALAGLRGRRPGVLRRARRRSGSRATSGRSPRGRSSSRASRCSGSRRRLPQAQWVETFLLASIGYPTLVASKAARIVEAAAGRPVYDFGAAARPRAARRDARRAGGVPRGLRGDEQRRGARSGWASRASGTMAHSWVQAFDDEAEAFAAFARVFPEHSTLLVDTYDTADGRPPRRRDRAPGPGRSGSTAATSIDLARAARAILDARGRRGGQDPRPAATSTSSRSPTWSRRGARIDAFGVGTELITSRDAPALSIVYKLVELDGAGPDQAQPGQEDVPAGEAGPPAPRRAGPVRARPRHAGRRVGRGRAAAGPGRPRGQARRAAAAARRDPRALPTAARRPARCAPRASTPGRSTRSPTATRWRPRPSGSGLSR